jgi:FkbM family methyltransferase
MRKDSINSDYVGEVNINYPSHPVYKEAKLSKETFDFRYEKLKQIIPEGSICLDIGSHIGNFTILFAACAGKTGKVLAFEPNIHCYEPLTQTIKDNPKFNIIPFNVGCTEETKKYTFNFANNEWGFNNGGYYKESKNPQNKALAERVHNHEVEVDGINTLEFLNSNHPELVDKINFIKTDCEGYDHKVLQTLVPLIKKNKPVMMVEAFKFFTQEESIELYDVIKECGYNMYDMSPLDNITDCVGPLSKEEFIYYNKEVIDNGNILCVHESRVEEFNLPKIVKDKTAVVLFGRNDGYKEKERFIIHVTTMLETFDEVIYVDWNSPEQSFLYEVMDHLPKTERLKHYVIPPEYAKLLTNDHPEAQRCSTVLAFNIGLRRTDAEWVVVSTTDIIPPFKQELTDFLHQANSNTFYTLSRREVQYKDIIDNIENLTEFREHLGKTSEPRNFPAKVTPSDEWSIFNCCGDFQLAHRNVWHKIRGYEEGMLAACFSDTNVQKKSTLYGFNLVPIYDIPLYHMSHEGMGNDGTNPTKQHYNDPWVWVEQFDSYTEHEHIMYSMNPDTWGFSSIEIEHEII